MYALYIYKGLFFQKGWNGGKIFLKNFCEYPGRTFKGLTIPAVILYSRWAFLDAWGVT